MSSKNPLIAPSPDQTLHNVASVLDFLKSAHISAEEGFDDSASMGLFHILDVVQNAVSYEANGRKA